LGQANEPAEALAAWERARAIRQKLVDDNPGVAEFRDALARILTNLGILLVETGRTVEARTSFERAVAILQKLADDNPADTGIRRDLANSYNEAGDVLRLLGRMAEARSSYERAVAIQEGLIKANPTSTQDQVWLVQGLKGLGATQLAGNQAADAVVTWRRAVSIGERLQSDYGETLYYLACCHALLGGVAGASGSGLLADEGPGEFGRAMELLRRAIAAGYRDGGRMRRDPDLDPLRPRPDFQLMMMDLAFPIDPFPRGD
jgi:tetratricopeptide (TPR) repeat protein